MGTTHRQLLGLCVLGFVLLYAYILARSAIGSLFVDSHGAEGLPAVWIIVAIATAVAVGIYGTLSTRVSLRNLFVGGSALSSGSLAALILLAKADPASGTYGLYIWQDVHIVLLVEMLWTFANIVFRIQTARWAYGLFLGVGSIAGIAAGYSADSIAAALGSAGALWIPAGLLLLLAALAFSAPKEISSADEQKTSLKQAFATFRSSAYLPWLLGLVALTQVTITVIDYEYNVMLEVAYPDTDVRTGVMGQVDAAINFVALGLQILSVRMLKWLGVSVVLLSVPVMLSGALTAFVVWPRALTAITLKVGSKAFDYSIFKAAKEILYIPLSQEEKTHGKALIDMLTYRVAKGGASALLALLVAWGLGTTVPLFVLLGAWILVTARIVIRFRSLTGEGESTENVHG